VMLDQNGSGPRQVICESLAPNSILRTKHKSRRTTLDQSSTFIFFFHSFDQVLVLSSVAGTLFFNNGLPILCNASAAFSAA